MQSSLKYTFTTIGLFIILVPVLSYKASAQDFDPFNGHAKDFHVKLERHFSSESEELKSRKVLLEEVKQYTDHKDWKLPELKSRLDQYEKLRVLIARHELYEKIKHLKNTKDTAAFSAELLMGNTADIIASVVDKSLQDPQVTKLTNAEIKALHLSDYGYMMMNARQNARHTLAPYGLQLISKLSDPILNGLTTRYDDLMDGIRIDSVPIVNGKKFNPITDRATLYTIKDQDLRTKLAMSFYQAYSAHKELAAATLIDITREETALAQVNGFKDAPTNIYSRKLQLPEDSVKAILAEMFSYADVLQRYQQLQSAQISKITGQQIVNSWDTNLPTGFHPIGQTFEEARSVILNALKPLGGDYVQHFSWLLNPQNGALEIAGGPNRASGGTSISYPGVPTSFYQKRFGGDLQSMLTMIHEGGHAIHRKLMGESLKVPTYSSGPNFLFEAFAVFNELLLFDGLIDSSKNVSEKIFYTKRFGDFLTHEIFTSAEEGSFEQGINDGVATGKINNSADIDSLYSGIMTKYDLYFKKEPVRQSEWVQRRLFFEDPLYNINYLYAILVACKLYDLSHKDPKTFSTNYNRLLRNGFDDTADHLLKRYMGFGLGHEALLGGAISLMNDKTEQLRKFYNADSSK